MAKKIVIYENTALINEMRSKLETCLPLLQAVYEKFKQMEFFNSDISIHQLLYNPGEIQNQYKLSLVREELKVTTNKLRISETEAVKLYQLAGTDELNGAINQALQTLQVNQIQVDYFEIKDGTVQINKSALQFFIDKNSVTATSPPEVELHDLLQKFIKSAVCVNDFLIKYRFPMKFLSGRRAISIEGFFDVDRDGNYVISKKYFPFFKKQLLKFKNHEKQVH